MHSHLGVFGSLRLCSKVSPINSYISRIYNFPSKMENEIWLPLAPHHPSLPQCDCNFWRPLFTVHREVSTDSFWILLTFLPPFLVRKPNDFLHLHPQGMRIEMCYAERTFDDFCTVHFTFSEYHMHSQIRRSRWLLKCEVRMLLIGCAWQKINDPALPTKTTAGYIQAILSLIRNSSINK